LGTPFLQKKRHIGKSSEPIKRPKKTGTKKFFATITIKVKAIIKTKK
jgi:hypothetical protein